MHDAIQVCSEVFEVLGFSQVVLQLKRKILRFKHIFIPAKKLYFNITNIIEPFFNDILY